MAESEYRIPAGRHRVEQVVERSRFIATLAPADTPDAARAFMDEVRQEFADATHNCWAFVAGPPGTPAPSA
jgi:putative IMPACT (imprinted ancient) family translation regulator